MDLLQRELARKKSLLAKASAVGQDGTTKKRKFLKQSELRRLEEEEEEERERLKRQKQQEELSKKEETLPAASDTSSTANAAKVKKSKKSKDSSSKVSSHAPESSSHDTSTAKETASTIISPQHVTQQLRALGLPIRFFGEQHTQRLERLQEALAQQHQTLQGLSEKEEFRLGQGHGIRNPFLERDDDDDEENTNNAKVKEARAKAKAKEVHKKDEGQLQQGEDDAHEADDDHDKDHKEDTGDDDNDPPKRIYRFLKGLLKDWEADLEARPSHIAKSVAGRNESKTLKQCKDYIRPLFKQLKRRKLEAGMQAHLIKIVEFAQQGEFVKAHDAYMDVAIGRAAWPIGVTMVGIHARSGRAKIESSNVAHVMNSELQRKYLTSVKRLLSYAQKKRPDVDPSKKVT